jgi:D-alanyl-D-alanine-carboxypeptidase/D-alanyl-D-alanine-endopeptidase
MWAMRNPERVPVLCFSRRPACAAAAIMLLLSCFVGPGSAPTAWAQTAPATIAGEYTGMLGTLHLRLHFAVDASGKTSGALDSLDQGAMGLPCADIKQDGQALSFAVPTVNGTWKGTVSSDGGTLSGEWNQGAPMPLNFARDTFVAAAKPSAVDGIWLGTLHAGSMSLRIQLHVRSNQAGQEYCTNDSVDQRAMGMECANVQFTAGNFSFDVPVVHGHWEGKLASDGNALSGTWSQGNPLPLNFARQTAAIEPPPPPPVVYDPAAKPATAADIEEVLKNDLVEALKSGELAPPTGAGVSIGVVEHGVRRVFSFGAAKADSIFEIGSITKTFTGLVLAQMVEQGKVKLDDPVRELLPSGTVAKPAGAEITLVDLATQHSGLPRMPDNFTPTNEANPYADYHAANMYAFLAKNGVGKPAQPTYLYSNYGFGLLGQALAVRAGTSYPELLKQEVLEPLGLRDTTIALSPAQETRFMPGHAASHAPAHAWDLDAFAGAGGIRSTAGDMLAYVEANLHPEAPRPASKTAEAGTLSKALVASHELRADAFGGQRIALAWHFDPSTGNYWHNGATGGYSSYAFFNPKGDYAAVVLLNTSIGERGSYADRVGEHISERLAGKQAISLAK